MTLPDERYRAVMYTRQFLLDLCGPDVTPRVPKVIRERARSLLRHYPGEWDMRQASIDSPDVFAERMEDVTKLFKKYEQSRADKNEA